MKIVRPLPALLAAALFTVASASGQGVINVGNYFLLPDTSGQLIELFVSGDQAVQGLNFNAQIGDGGPAAGGTNSGPSISAVFLLEDTIFAGNNNGQHDPGSFPQLAIRTVSTFNGTVRASGLLAKVVIDTTGFQQGTWTFALKNTLNGPTDFAGRPVTITDGTLSIIPEPGTSVIFLLGLGALWRLRVWSPAFRRRAA